MEAIKTVHLTRRCKNTTDGDPFVSVASITRDATQEKRRARQESFRAE